MLLFIRVYVYRIYTQSVCDRIENSDGTGPDWDHFGRNRTGLQARKS